MIETTIEVNGDDLDRQLIAQLPWIDWSRPVMVCQGVLTRYGCRLCIARKGLRGEHVNLLANSAGKVIEHIATAHPALRPSVKT